MTMSPSTGWVFTERATGAPPADGVSGAGTSVAIGATVAVGCGALAGSGAGVSVAVGTVVAVGCGAIVGATSSEVQAMIAIAVADMNSARMPRREGNINLSSNEINLALHCWKKLRVHKSKLASVLA